MVLLAVVCLVGLMEMAEASNPQLMRVFRELRDGNSSDSSSSSEDTEGSLQERFLAMKDYEKRRSMAMRMRRRSMEQQRQESGGMAMGPCKTCVFLLERVKKGTNELLPSICSELFVKDPPAYPIVSSVVPPSHAAALGLSRE